MGVRSKILVVDDDQSIRFFLEEMLARDEHDVVAVGSGAEALARVQDHEFDLALIDLKLQDMSGIEVMSALRQQSPDTVMIVLTAHASLETAVEALRQGAHDYLFKPCKTVELRESINRGLANRRQKARQREFLQQLERKLSHSLQDLRAAFEAGSAGGTVDEVFASLSPDPAEDTFQEHARFLRHSGLIVDLMRHVVTLDGTLLELSPTEFDLLAYLVGEAPRIVPAQELVREVQGYESEPWEASETVRYHIYRIRQKAKEATGRTDLIRTVRGVGYTVG